MEIAVEQFGYVTTDNARSAGVAPASLRAMAHRGDAERVSHGVYRLRMVPDTGREQLMEATLWPRGRGVISHDSALDLWDVCDINPAKVHITVPEGTRPHRRPIPAAYVLHERDLDAGDVTYLDGIPVVTLRRAILDGIERHIRDDLIEQAIDTGRATGMLRAASVDLRTGSASASSGSAGGCRWKASLHRRDVATSIRTGSECSTWITPERWWILRRSSDCHPAP